ncbi:helix-turn-helix domain-containing protein, partial [[Eubacterium] rectale]|jgi:response regulator containing cheY-like receiver, AAA-type ATPase, and DNA-binding domains
VLILGENGTGKGKAASLIYKQSNYKHAPFYSIDCSLIKERKWHSLLNNENSPLNEVDSTVFFEKADALSLEQIGDLFQYIDQTKLCTRMRLIVSLSTNNSNQPAFATIRTFMENHLSCLTLNLPPLRERIDDFSGITALYLHRFNVSLGKQIIGFDVEAMEKMLSYNWPNNLDQLQHVLKELVTITKTPYISCDTVEAILKQEPDYGRVFDDSVKFDGTLDEINYQIILQVLHEEHDNKEKTARRLGISRSTLWRILKNNN